MTFRASGAVTHSKPTIIIPCNAVCGSPPSTIMANAIAAIMTRMDRPGPARQRSDQAPTVTKRRQPEREDSNTGTAPSQTSRRPTAAMLAAIGDRPASVPRPVGKDAKHQVQRDVPSDRKVGRHRHGNKSQANRIEHGASSSHRPVGCPCGPVDSRAEPSCLGLTLGDVIVERRVEVADVPKAKSIRPTSTEPSNHQDRKRRDQDACSGVSHELVYFGAVTMPVRD